MTAIANLRDQFSLDVLELPAIIDLLRPFLSGRISEPLLPGLTPRADIAAIERALALAREARESLDVSPRPSFAALADPRPILERLRIEGVSATALEIYAVIEVARAAGAARGLFQKTPLARLDALAHSVPDLGSLVRELGGKILPDGTVDSSASPALARIRRSLERVQQELRTRLEKLLRRFAQEKSLREEIITLRNGRFVLPIRSERQRAVEGIVHGTSSSGATVYIEPIETLALNNHLVTLHDREAAEIQRILGEFSSRLRTHREELLEATEIVSQLDLAFAKAEFVLRYRGCFPEFSETRNLLLKEARNPLLEDVLAASGRQAVPLTIELGPPRTIIVVSGPNTGGKTVAIKTIGTAALMAQAGLPVLASEARLPLFQRVLADIGDRQSIEQSLSTFSAHIQNIDHMVREAEEGDLVLLDEIGSSTDPEEGAALAVAILEHCRQRRIMTCVTTHLSRLKAYAARTPEAVNAAMDFDEAMLRPTYKVVMGLPGKSSGLDTALRLGLDRHIVEQARSLLDPAQAEAANLVTALHAQKAALELEREHALQRLQALEGQTVALQRQLEAEHAAKLKVLDGRLEQVLREYDKKWKAALEELRRQVQVPAARAFSRSTRAGEKLQREAREEWNAQVLEARAPPPGPEENEIAGSLEAGARVRVKDFSTPGVVTAVFEGDQIEVEIGRLRMRVGKNDVRVLAHQPAARIFDQRPAAQPEPGSEEPSGRALRPAAGLSRSPLEADSEINVIGETAEAARERVDEFLDRAYLAGRFKVRVIHGLGKGVLRKTLHEMFACHPHVESFYAAERHQGGEGATIVEIKR